MRARRRYAHVAWRSGSRHRFPVPGHYRIFTDGDDYVIGCYQTRCEVWRQPKAVIAALQLQEIEEWLM